LIANANTSSQDLDGLAHGGLDVDLLDVLPLLLEQGSQEIQGHNDVLSDFLVVHGLVGDSDVKVSNLLQLPLDGSLDVIDLLLEWFVMGDWLWELTDSVKNWSKYDWDFLNERIGGEEKGELLSPLLNQLLVLVELLELIKSDDLDVNFVGLDLIEMLLIGN
jgi:hypothetical protein